MSQSTRIVRTPKTGFGTRGLPERNWASSAPQATGTKRSRTVALSLAGGLGLLGLYAAIPKRDCDKPTDFAAAEAKKGSALTLDERESLVQQNLAEERRCQARGGRSAGSYVPARSWLGRSATGSRTLFGMPLQGRTAAQRGGFGRSGFSFGG